MQHSQGSDYLNYRNGRLHLKVLTPQSPPKGVVLMVHGAMSNGRVFYSDKGKGLGCYLADQGYLVYVLDCYGHGLSHPPLAHKESHGQYEIISEQLPLVQQWLHQRHGGAVHWVGHSWGGVLMIAALARYPQLLRQVQTLSLFASKRTVRSWSSERLLKIELAWKRLFPWLGEKLGYLPLQRLRVGMDDQSTRFLLDSLPWISQRQWLDERDGFDYGDAARTLVRQGRWPVTWFAAGAGDRALGNPRDVHDLMQECGLAGQAQYQVFGRSQGFRRDYDHAGLLTHRDAAAELFPNVLSWLQQPQWAGDIAAETQG
ncbi:alpha/beta fold hydrolase [Ferrimonas sp. SCSIO 43195]|uniref:alpha/beta fold hydrolase n=1 Tax=Ferrimonas sp. SCSIO 43195 TaxID=2822844 RepID=UPI0020765F70|nr:alpha/beta fold hydrolase [Ferrimonas sp. SCSIO 43195]USD38477.1 alpha/beta fold hydrolase [Ferrimonas sp. SCSIO 43195]